MPQLREGDAEHLMEHGAPGMDLQRPPAVVGGRIETIEPQQRPRNAIPRLAQQAQARGWRLRMRR